MFVFLDDGRLLHAVGPADAFDDEALVRTLAAIRRRAPANELLYVHPKADTTVAARNDPCGIAGLPDDFDVVVVSVYKGSTPLDVAIDRGGHEVTREEVVVGVTPKPVVLVLMGYDPIVWNVGQTADANIAGILAQGAHRQAVIGVPKATPMASYSSADGPNACRSFRTERADDPALGKRVRELFGRGVATFLDRKAGPRFVVGKVAGEAEYSPEIALASVALPGNVMPGGQRGIDRLVREKSLRLATEGEVAAWVNGAARQRGRSADEVRRRWASRCAARRSISCWGLRAAAGALRRAGGPSSFPPARHPRAASTLAQHVPDDGRLLLPGPDAADRGAGGAKPRPHAARVVPDREPAARAVGVRLRAVAVHHPRAGRRTGLRGLPLALHVFFNAGAILPALGVALLYRSEWARRIACIVFGASLAWTAWLVLVQIVTGRLDSNILLALGTLALSAACLGCFTPGRGFAGNFVRSRNRGSNCKRCHPRGSGRDRGPSSSWPAGRSCWASSPRCCSPRLHFHFGARPLLDVGPGIGVTRRTSFCARSSSSCSRCCSPRTC